jgi:hypothetical protein
MWSTMGDGSSPKFKELTVLTSHLSQDLGRQLPKYGSKVFSILVAVGYKRNCFANWDIFPGANWDFFAQS